MSGKARHTVIFNMREAEKELNFNEVNHYAEFHHVFLKDRSCENHGSSHLKLARYEPNEEELPSNKCKIARI